MICQRIAWAAAVLIISAVPTDAHDQTLQSGEQVYKKACFACHATKVEKAPQFGDRTVWAPLIKEGQHVLTAHAWVGVRNMPAKGGSRICRSRSLRAPPPTWRGRRAGTGKTRMPK